MKNIFILCMISGLVLGQTNFSGYKGQVDSLALPKVMAHFLEEYTFDKSLDTVRWLNEKSGMQVSFGSTDRLYYRSEVPELENKSLFAERTGWKGERLNFMILVWSAETVHQIRFTMNDLQSHNSKINKKNFKLNLVRYVLSNYPYNAQEVTCGVPPENIAYLLPDRFEEFDRFDLPARSVRPIWCSLDIPSDAKPGIYESTINIASEKYSTTLNLKIKVQDLLLPKPKDWKFRLDLWQNPWAVAKYFKVKPWSEEHKFLLKKHLKLYADAGGKFITTYAVYSPWSDETYYVDETMIEWIKRKDGSWTFDYNIFDQYVQLSMDAGITEAITIYTPIPWGNRFRYLDENTGNYVYATWTPESKEFVAFWNVFLDDLKKHLEAKGWFEKTYLGVNENEMSQTLAAIKVIKDHSKKWRLTYAGDWHPELDKLLDDYSSVYGKEPGLDEINDRNSRGFTSTYYICCTPPKPNTFICSPPSEARWLGWYTSAHNYNGLLRWAYESWPADPIRDARHVYWAAGDCFIVYPGATSGIRFEKLKEGIADFEKLRIIRETAAKMENPNIKNSLKQLNTLMNTFIGDFDEANIENSIHQGLNILEQLSDLVTTSKTEYGANIK